MEGLNQHTVPDFSATNVRQVPSTNNIGQILTFNSMDEDYENSDYISLHGNFDLDRVFFYFKFLKEAFTSSFSVDLPNQ